MFVQIPFHRSFECIDWKSIIKPGKTSSSILEIIEHFFCRDDSAYLYQTIHAILFVDLSIPSRLWWKVYNLIQHEAATAISCDPKTPRWALSLIFDKFRFDNAVWRNLERNPSTPLYVRSQISRPPNEWNPPRLRQGRSLGSQESTHTTTK